MTFLVTQSSVANLRVVYATRLQTMHNTIEGSAKFVPAIPGRHIVSGMGDVLALNPAMYKVENTVHFVLLDDSLVAERCWLLTDMSCETSKIQRVMEIELRHGKETHVYRVERLKEKKTLLSFRQASEDLAERKDKEREGKHERRRKMAERDARWVEDFSDDLTVAIALGKWEEAVELVEIGEKRLSTTPMLAPKFTTLKVSLTTALLQTLSDPMQRKLAVVHLISLLERLGAGATARSTFLAVRGELMRTHVRALRFEGSVELYISDLAIVVFTGIKPTEWFLSSFRENDTASESYAEMFRKQVHRSDVASQMVQDCLAVTRLQNRKLLKDDSLDFSYLLELLLTRTNEPIPQAPPSFS
ncbi:Cullin repeat-like-containing domain protein [Hysterangium stoloniferum]|nr:Cullin repeat-like-containing domain protein [Hysterangium stoloniferum]